MPMIKIENHYDASPDFVQSWLLDYRPDDAKWFGGAETTTVKKDGNKVHLEKTDDMGTWFTTVNTGHKHTWNFDARCEKKGKVLLSVHGVERLQQAGGGTDHFVALETKGGSLVMRLMLPMMKGKMGKEIKAGFDKMRPVIEEEHAASTKKT